MSEAVAENTLAEVPAEPAVPKQKPLTAKLTGLAKWRGRLAALVTLIGLAWAGGRIYEIATAKVIFEPLVAYWLVIAALACLALVLTMRLVDVIASTIASGRPTACLAWLPSAALAAYLVVFFSGCRLASVALAALLGGLSHTLDQALTLLFKFCPSSPQIPLILLSDFVVDLPSPLTIVRSYLWSIDQIQQYGFVSLALAIVFFFIKGGAGLRKMIHLALVLAGLALLVDLTAVLPYDLVRTAGLGEAVAWLQNNRPGNQTIEFRLWAHVAAVGLGWIQFSIAATLLSRRFGPAGGSAAAPGGYKLLFWAIVLGPLLGDMWNRWLMVRAFLNMTG